MDALPIVTTGLNERWDCRGCGLCCRGLIVELDATDLRRLREQDWRRHPDFRGVKTSRRLGGGGQRLNQHADGRCVFLTPDERCRIHQEFGHAAKPLVCRTYPLQLIPQPGATTLSVRRSCPSAAADRGRPLEEHVELARELIEEGAITKRSADPPPIAEGRSLPWPETLETLALFERETGDAHDTLAARIRRGLALCERLEREASRQTEPATAPADGTLRLFRQVALQYLLHDRARPRLGFFRERLLAVRAAKRFWHGDGSVPEIVPRQPRKTFEELDRSLRESGAAIPVALERWFSASVASRQDALLGRPDWPVVDSFRSTALTVVVAAWKLRLLDASDADRVFEVVASVDQAHAATSLVSRFHHSRIRALTRDRQLETLVRHYLEPVTSLSPS